MQLMIDADDVVELGRKLETEALRRLLKDNDPNGDYDENDWGEPVERSTLLACWRIQCEDDPIEWGQWVVEYLLGGTHESSAKWRRIR